MDSHLPTRPSSDLHRRFSTRARPSAIMDKQPIISPRAPRQNRHRSSSLSGISQSLSRLLPSNRAERGGTARPKDTVNEISDVVSPPKSLIQILSVRGRGDERRVAEEQMMKRAKSLSPKKTSLFDDERIGLTHMPNKPKTPSTLQRLWELQKGANIDPGIIDISQNHGRLHSDRQESSQSRPTTTHVRVTGQETDRSPSVPVGFNVRESVAALKRSQQLFEEKRARREERRSFRRSDDFIGVQGVNPRTGYPDPSSGTSSSAGDALSESTRKRLGEDEKRMEIASREYKAALERREKEIRRLELERERRRVEKKERVERKRAQLRAKVRKDGRWKNDGNTWSMVTEPGLSPIVQSITGTPIQENAPQDLLSPTNRDLAARQSTTMRKDDMGQIPSPPSTPQRNYDPKISSTTYDLREQNTHPYRVESASKAIQRRGFRGRSDNGNASYENDTKRQIVLPIRRKEVGSPISCRHVSSSETVIHRTQVAQPLPIELPENPGLNVPATPPSVNPTLRVTTPGETTHIISTVSPPPGSGPFLDILRKASQNVELQGSRAIATSYQLSSVSSGETHHRLLQNQRDIFQDTHTSTLKHFPPVLLKDPISAGIPVKTQGFENPLPSPNTNPVPRLLPQEQLGQIPGITIPITTTTGFEGLPRPPSQIGGSKVASENRLNHQDQPVINTRISTPNCHQKETLSGMPNFGFQVNQADIAISSAHHPPALWTPTKSHFQRPHQQALSKADSVTGQKSISISTFTPPPQQIPAHQSVGAKNAAQASLTKTTTYRLCHEVKARSASLVSPKLGIRHVAEQPRQEYKTLSEGSVGIEDPSKALEKLNKSPQLISARTEYVESFGGPARNSSKDEFTVWYTETKRRVRFNDDLREELHATRGGVPVRKHEGAQSLPCKNPRSADKGSRALSLLRKTYELAMGAIGTAWSFVLPVFNPHSSLRWRWLRNELTWQDVVLIGAAGIFGGGAFLIMVLLARLLGVGMQIVKGCIRVCRVLAEL